MGAVRVRVAGRGAATRADVSRLSDLDAAFLHADTPTQHLHVLATLVLDTSAAPAGSVGYRTFQQRMRERVPLVEPMRRRPVEVPGGPTLWAEDSLDQLDRHLHHVVDDGGGIGALAARVGDVASVALPKDRPLWEVWFVEDLGDDRVGVIAKIHHAAVDGVSGIWSLAAFFDLEPSPQPMNTEPWVAAPPPSVGDMGRAMFDQVRVSPADVARRLGRVIGSARAFAGPARGEAPLPMTAPRLSINGALTPRRTAAFARVPLDGLKDIRRAFSVTVNDVITGLVAGVVRQELIERGELVDRPLVAAVPTSEREAEHGLSGNRLSFMLYGLPTHVADPADRLRAVQRSALAAKALHVQAGTGLLADLAGLVPPGLVAPAMRAVSALRLANTLPPFANVIISNVRGPDFPLFVAGARLESMFPMGPLMEGVGLGVTAVSYRDEVGFGFLACPDLVPDVSRIAAGVEVELERLQSAAASELA